MKRHILITGASRGLGRALAERYLREGHRVTAVARSFAEPLEGAHHIEADVAEVDPARLLGEAVGALGPVDTLIHIASTLGPVPLVPLLDTEADELLRATQVNLLAPFGLSRAAAGAMAVRQEGTIVYISSDAAVQPYATWGAYGASKAAGAHLHAIWAEELAEHGVRIVTVDPGEMNTQMHSDAMPDADPNRLASPEDIADRLFARWASSEAGRWELQS